MIVVAIVLTADLVRLPISWLPGALLLTVLMAVLPLWFWDSLRRSLLRGPAVLAVDLAVTAGILLVTGGNGPFLHYGLTTAALAGLLTSGPGAAASAAVLAAAQALTPGFGAEVAGAAVLQELLGLPALHPLFTAAMAMVRRLLIRQARTEDALTSAVERATAAQERARLAREMHDSVTKTLQGLALSAAAVERAAQRGAPQTTELAGSLTSAARTAASEARELINDLRVDRLEDPLEAAIRQHITAWSEQRGVPATFTSEGDAGELSSGARYELFAILKEALRNVERHAQACHVQVTLRAGQRAAWLAVSDDGIGFGPPSGLAELAAAGHYGLVGMAERAERAGGYLDVVARPGAGVTVSAVVPYVADDA